MPDGTALITERAGRLRMVRNGKLLPEPVAGVPPVFAQNQGGLLDVSVHPRFADNGFAYLTYAHGTAEANSTRVARARLVGNRLEDLRVGLPDSRGSAVGPQAPLGHAVNPSLGGSSAASLPRTVLARSSRQPLNGAFFVPTNR